MATPRLFKLKSQVAPALTGPPASQSPFARIWVDTGVYHLDQPYDYQVPETLSDLVQTGIRVQVPFGTREVEGLVISREVTPNSGAKIKSITKVLSPHAVATPQTIDLFEKTAQRWASNPWEIITSAIPARVASVDKTFTPQQRIKQLKKSTVTSDWVYQALAAHHDPYISAATIALTRMDSGSVLVIAPDETDVLRLENAFVSLGQSPIRLDSALARAERYSNFLTVADHQAQLIIGSRNAIFSPLPPGSTILIFKESSPEFYEIRTPGWNVRDIAIMRRKNESLNLIFCGFSPSLNIAAKIEAKRMRYVGAPSSTHVETFSSMDSSLLPDRIFKEIRTQIKRGPVLFLLSRKGYANAILCAHCKNFAACSCGSKLTLASKNAAPLCKTCGRSESQWKCKFCGRDKKYALSRGIERAAEEISRAFPNIPVTLSYGDVIKESVKSQPSLVLCTPGAAPVCKDGYAAVVILEALTFFSHDDLRANERAIELFFEIGAMTRESGSILLAIDDSHPIVSSLKRWNPAIMLKRELAQNEEVNLPPTSSSAVLVLPSSQATSFGEGLRAAISDARLPSDVRVLGPSMLNQEKSKIVVLSRRESAPAVVSFLHELMRRRSIARKTDAILRIDPYSL